MSTRGFITFVVDGTEKTAYNHCDSYPDGLGVTMLDFLRARQHELTCELHKGASGSAVSLARALRVVSPDSPPPAEDVTRLSKYSWSRAQHGGDKILRDGQEWYDLLHETQGSPALMLEAGVIEDAAEFPADSLMAEWGYVVDFDAGAFEVYRGFQTAAHDLGRFAGRVRSRPYGNGIGPYYPVALIASWPFGELPDEATFLAALSDDEDNEG